MTGAAAITGALEPDASLGVVVSDEHGQTVLVSPSVAAVDGLHERLASALAATLASGDPVPRLELEHGVASLHRLEHRGRRYAAAVVALDRADERLAAALRLARLGTFSYEPRTERRTWSEEVYRQAGLDPAEPPDPDAWLAAIDPADRGVLEATLDRALRTGEPWEVVVRRVAADGPDRFILNKGLALGHAGGGVAVLQGFTQDVTERTRLEAKQRAVARLSHGALAGLALPALMQFAADVVAEALGIDFVGVLEVDPDDVEWVIVRAGHGQLASDRNRRMPLDSPRYFPAHVVRTGEPVLIADWESGTTFERPARLTAGGVRCTAAVAIGRPPRPWGILSAHSRRPRHVTADDVAFLQAAANVLASALDRLHDEEEIAALAAARGRLVAQALDAEDRTRREISELLHDGPLQELLALDDEVARLEPRDDREALHRERARDGVARAVRQLREAMVDLHPVALDVGGLAPAIAAVTRQQAGVGGFQVTVDVAPDAAGERDELVVAVARELLVNAARHAGAQHVRVSVSRAADGIVLEVADDGSGIAPGRLSEALRDGHIGLASAQERLEAIGGSLELDGGPGAGTTAVALLPLP
jgi:signal transduction histidine kinase/PAS domain-containing protein